MLAIAVGAGTERDAAEADEITAPRRSRAPSRGKIDADAGPGRYHELTAMMKQKWSRQVDQVQSCIDTSDMKEERAERDGDQRHGQARDGQRAGQEALPLLRHDVGEGDAGKQAGDEERQLQAGVADQAA
ncbi:MAG: hypothetical protein R3C69_04330 [Geminicoccaceae bacterium]